MLHKIKFYGSIGTIYILTLGTIGAVIYSPSHLSGQAVSATETQTVTPIQPTPTRQKIISGKPTRIVIASAGIDLPIVDGHYDKQSKSWTLTPDKAHFATMTERPNDYAGTTFIYGHGTAEVFGKIGENPPPSGTTAQIYTDNNHVFLYTLRDVSDLKPHQTDVLKNTSDSSPQLIVQTCTGVFSEWRTMFTFTLQGVV